MKQLVAILFFAALAHGEIFNFGIKGGVPFNNVLEAGKTGNISYVTSSPRFVAGAGFELDLPFVPLIEADILFRRTSYDATVSSSPLSVTASSSGNVLDFPILMKFRLPGIIARPFFSTGPVFRYAGGFSTSSLQSGNVVSAVQGSNFIKGGAFAFGVDIKPKKKLKITPELRWNFFPGQGGIGQFKTNSAELLVGVYF